MAKKEVGYKLSTPIFDMASEEYHSTKGTYSSSQLKDLLDDPEIFYEKWIAKTVEKKTMDAFDVGTYFHTAVLEPHNLNKECVVYPGRRVGQEWEAFKQKHKGKAILNLSMEREAKALVANIKKSSITMNRLKKCKPEVSIFVELYITGGEVYVPSGNLILSKTGWVPFTGKIPKGGVPIIVKVRADALGPDFILDLKSVRGNVKSQKSMMGVVSRYGYDLSAALYLDIFSAGLGIKMKHFIWSFVSKDFFNARSYRASERNILIGRAKWKKAIIELAHGIANEWHFDDFLGILEPEYYQLEYLNEGYESIL